MSGTGLQAVLGLRRSEEFRLDISLSIPPGRTAALLGPNGAGKSTVVALLAGSLALERGMVSLDNVVLDDPARDVFVPPEHRRIGVVFQDGLLFPHLSVLDNVAFGPRSSGMGRRESSELAGDWLSRLGLSTLARSRAGDLSGGQAQLVALARALVIEPDLLLLDEPLSALDVTTRAGLRRTLGEHLDSFPGPRLLITHDPSEAFLLATEISVIEDGSITQSGSADDLRLRPRSRYAADLAGSNLIRGTAAEGVVDAGACSLHIADREVAGPVLATIRPSAISVHRHAPEGSPRNSWATSVDHVEHLGERVRLRTGEPLPLAVEITEEAAQVLGLAAGSEIWISIKATEIGVESDLPGDVPEVQVDSPRPSPGNR